MTLPFLLLTIVFIVVSGAMILIILVQRPQGGGLAGAFGGAGGGSTDTVFGGRVGDALTVMTVVAFLGYLALAIGLNLVPIRPAPATAASPVPSVTGTTAEGETMSIPLTPADGPPPGFDPNTPMTVPPADTTPPPAQPVPEPSPPTLPENPPAAPDGQE